MPIHYIHLTIAIILEVIATSAMKASNGFTVLIPSVIMVIGYAFSFYFLSLTLKVIPIGVTYAAWAGLGIVLVAIVGAVLFRQIPDLPAILGMVLILAGVFVINVYSKTVSH